MIEVLEGMALIFFLFGALTHRDRHRAMWWGMAAVLAFVVLVNTP